MNGMSHAVRRPTCVGPITGLRRSFGRIGAFAILAIGLLIVGPAVANDQSASEVANELANPNTSLGFMALQLDYINYQGDLRRADSQNGWRFNFQPSLPYPIAKDTNFFVRPLIPVIFDQPVPNATGFEGKGVELGDISADVAIGTGFSNGLTLIGGMVGSLPTATDDDLGANSVLLGPEALIGQKTSWGFYGALFTHQWDTAGDQVNQNVTGGQYFYTVNLPDAWQIQAQPTWSYNHEASKDKLTLPLGTGVSKTVIIRGMPVKFLLQYWYYVVSPDSFGPEHQLRLQIAPVVPLPW